MNSRFLLVLAIAVACSKAPPDVAPEVVPEAVSSVRIAPSEQPLAYGDCVEARRRAALAPDLPVDRIPSVLVAKPAALEKLPAAARRKDGSAEVKVDVLVDTLGKADMKTFKVVTASSPLLANNVKAVIGRWTFSPAELAGCKVPRVYHFMANAPARKK
jgi:outer membrane biosynthesis protein TonB